MNGEILVKIMPRGRSAPDLFHSVGAHVRLAVNRRKFRILNKGVIGPTKPEHDSLLVSAVPVLVHDSTSHVLKK